MPNVSADHGRPVLQRERAQAGNGDVLAEVEDLVASTLQYVGSHAEPEDVVLPFDGCEQDVGPRAALVPPGAHGFEQPNQRVLCDGGREVLVRNTEHAQLPQLPDPHHRRGDDHRLDDLGRQAGGECLVHDLFGSRAVPDAQNLFEPAGQHADPRVASTAKRHVGWLGTHRGHHHPAGSRRLLWPGPFLASDRQVSLVVSERASLPTGRTRCGL